MIVVMVMMMAIIFRFLRVRRGAVGDRRGNFRHEKELMKGEGERERRAHAIPSPDKKSTYPSHGKREPAIPLSILDNEAFLQT